MINIAIVDNEKSVLENIREILLNLSGEFKDVHIDTYEKAENFLVAFETIRYQILISDVDMPEINGMSACGIYSGKNQCLEWTLFLTTFRISWIRLIMKPLQRHRLHS